MRSEWSPIKSSKKDVKRRLDSLFGEYSHFAVRPDQEARQYSAIDRGNDKEKIISCDNTEDYLGNRCCKFEKSNSKSPEKYSTREQPKSNLDSLIGELVNISKPLSPVSIQCTPTKTEAPNTQESEVCPKNKNETKLTLDLNIILEQISRVSPLLSPINLEAREEQRQKQQFEVELSKNSRKRQNDTKFLNGDRIKFVRLDLEQSSDHKMNRKEDQSLHYYSIKLNEEIFQKLLERINHLPNSLNQQKNRFAADSHIKGERNSKQPINSATDTTDNGCVRWARKLFDTLYYDEIARLRHEQVTQEQKILFNANNFPQPLHFDVNKVEHMDFVYSAFVIRAQLYGVEQIMDRQKVAQIADAYNNTSSSQ